MILNVLKSINIIIMNKKNLGQFYTTNYSYILQGFKVPPSETIIEPFVGNGDLVKFSKRDDVECYDIDPKIPCKEQRDTLLHPPDYNNKFVITNPPYLAKNKNKLDSNRIIYEKYNLDDLYKCFLLSIIEGKASGGIVIIPVNFWCSIRKKDIELRKRFLFEYDIVRLNIFYQQVFIDTTYNVCSFQFKKKQYFGTIKEFPITLYPSSTKITSDIDTANFLIGGGIYHLPTDDKIKITRLTKQNKNSEDATKIKVVCIDQKTPIQACFDSDRYIDNTPNLSARSFATLVISPRIDEDCQKRLITEFNMYITNERKKYNSLFLTNYRDKNRKRISFNLIYKIFNYLLSKQKTIHETEMNLQ